MQYVLIAENNDASRETLIGALSAEGYRVVAVSSGPEILDALVRYGCPSVLVLDTRISEMQAGDVTNVMQLNPRWRDVPVLLIAQSGPESGRVDPSPLLEEVQRHAKPTVTTGPITFH